MDVVAVVADTVSPAERMAPDVTHTEANGERAAMSVDDCHHS